MKKNISKYILCFLLSALFIFNISGCGANKETSTVEDKIEYDENGNPIVEEKERTDKEILSKDSLSMISGLIAVMDNGNITTNGVWMTEGEVGKISERCAEFQYTYEKGKFKKNDIKYVATFYDINNELSGAIYLTENMDMCYNNEYLIEDPILKGLFLDIKNRIKDDSVISGSLESDNAKPDVIQDDSNEKSPSANNIFELSKVAFEDAGIDSEVAGVIAQSTFNLNIPVVVSASVSEKQDEIYFTDENDYKYIMKIEHGSISSIWCETDNSFRWPLDEIQKGE